MKTRSAGMLAALTAVAALVSACETTGDPKQGGLFGWSETKAQQRLAGRQSDLAREEMQRVHEDRESAALAQSQERVRSSLAARRPPPLPTARADEREATELARLADEANRLEANSPTPAGASRARRLRAAIQRMQHDSVLSAGQRAEGIAEIRAELERSGRQLGLTPR